MDAKALAAGRRTASLLAVALLGFGVACATPVGVARVDPRVVHRTLTSNVLSTSQLSNPTTNVLYRRDLSARFASQPEVVLAELHAEIGRASCRERVCNDV